MPRQAFVVTTTHPPLLSSDPVHFSSFILSKVHLRLIHHFARSSWKRWMRTWRVCWRPLRSPCRLSSFYHIGCHPLVLPSNIWKSQNSCAQNSSLMRTSTSTSLASSKRRKYHERSLLSIRQLSSSYKTMLDMPSGHRRNRKSQTSSERFFPVKWQLHWVVQ